MKDKKSYYAIIPSDVRYNKNLTANAKLLYGEITALCNKEGYCWASNSYFAALYEVSNTSISKWISDLKANKHINISSKGVRKIFIQPLTKVNEGFEEKLKHNNTVILHNTKIKESSPLSFIDVVNYFKAKGSTKEEAESFNDYFTNKDWKLNNNKKMIDWRLAANNWIKRSKVFNNTNPNQLTAEIMYNKNQEKEKYKEMAYHLDFPNYFDNKLLNYLTHAEIVKYKEHLKKINYEETNTKTGT